MPVMKYIPAEDNDLWSGVFNLFNQTNRTIGGFKNSLKTMSSDKGAKAAEKKIQQGIALTNAEDHQLKLLIGHLKQLVAKHSTSLIKKELHSHLTHLTEVEKDSLESRKKALLNLQSEMKKLSVRPQKKLKKETAKVGHKLTKAQKDMANYQVMMDKWHQAAKDGEMWREIGTIVFLIFPFLLFPIITMAACKKTTCTMQTASILILFSMITTWTGFVIYLNSAVVGADICRTMDQMEANPAKFVPQQDVAMVEACLSRTPLTKALHLNSHVEPVKVHLPEELNTKSLSATNFDLASLEKVIAKIGHNKEAAAAAKKAQRSLHTLQKHIKQYLTNQNELMEKIKPVTLAAQTLSTGDCSNVNLAYREVKTIVCGEILTDLARMASVLGVAGILILFLAVLVPCATTRQRILDKSMVFSTPDRPFI